MEKQMTKLGARELTEQEMSLILPNWKKIEEQIEIFRNNIEDGDKPLSQKTNNIGIIGCRGAGKTSILRTFRNRLAKNKNNIVLPIVVPEDMSSSNSLMDVILGMFKQFVDERKKSGQSEECIFKGRDSLELSYNEMVKQYCYIKKDYRNILIQQFTTEQYYLDKTKEVFNSDTVFIEKFNEFIKALMKTQENTQNQEKKMIFLFIDDIDLSATRCIEVAKALLSYLSNQRIVTFISGDMETFEEALTLDFLRQEKALDSGVFSKTYYNTSEGDGVLLDRKRLLAYEYLKKIIPPAYRFLIKYWSLEDRGNYQIGEKGAKNFCSYLCDVLGSKVGSEYFSYLEGEKSKHFPYTFCMFDDTSRGLNNVYNVLVGLAEHDSVGEAEEKKAYFPEKTLVETMIASKILYARHTDELLKKIIVFEEKQVHINFDSAYNFIYKKRTVKITDKKEDEKGGYQYRPTERFEFFVFIDFAARLFVPHSLKQENYLKLKDSIVEDFIKHEEIEGKIPASSQRNIQITALNEKAQQNGDYKLLREFIKKGDFLFDLYFIKYLGRDTIEAIVESKKSNRDYTYSIAYALSETISSMKPDESMQRDYITELYPIFTEQINKLLSEISLNPSVLFGDTVLKDLADPGDVFLYQIPAGKNTADMYFELVENYIRNIKKFYSGYWANYYHKKTRFWIYFDWVLKTNYKTFDLSYYARNLVYNGILKTGMKLMEKELKNYTIAKLSDEEYKKILNKKDEVVLAVDQRELWEHSYVRINIKRYLEGQIKSCVRTISSHPILFDISSILSPQGAYIQFKNRKKSITGKALVDELDTKLEKILFLGKSSDEVEEIANAKYISLEHLMVIQCLLENFLYDHPKAKYGKQEIKRLLMESRETPILLNEWEDNKIWEQIQEKVMSRENSFFNDMFKEVKKLDENQVKEILMMYSLNNNKTLSNILKDVDDGHMENIELNLAQYEIYERKIQSYVNEANIQWDIWGNWGNSKKMKFYFHSYLRYLQANDKNMERIGKRAEVVAQFAQLLLDSEDLADKREQGEIFEILSNAIGLTEEEFEQLF